jgi:ankyrin repeat protein
LVQLLLKHEKPDEATEYILDIYDSKGDPLFFKPLMYDNFALFSLYIKLGTNIHMLNAQGHNIFYEYVTWVFERDDSSPTTCRNFRDNLSSLVSRKVDKHFKDALGWTVLHKVTATECNLKLFNELISNVRFDYSVSDNLGRTIIHNCVWHNKPEIIKLVYKMSPKTINDEDIYHIPAIYYAALLGSRPLVSLFFTLGASITSSRNIEPKARKKFKPMLKNLDKLIENVEDESEISRNESLIEMIKKKFEA